MNDHRTQQNPFLAWALYYATEKHFSVFPLAPHQKVPCKGSRGLLDATTDEVQIRQWWEETPNANIAVRTGELIFALDEDPRHGGEETIAKLIQQHGRLVDTLEAVTPNGGRHRIYLTPEQVEIPTRAPARDDWAGVDVRGTGGYIAVHPSMVLNESGRLARYEWDGMKAEEEPIAPAPAWLVEAILHTANGTGPVELPERLEKGSRDQTLYRMACAFRRARADYADVVARLVNYDARHCIPPLGAKIVEQKVKQAWKHPAGDGQAAAVPEQGLKAGNLMSKSITEVSAEPVEWLWHNRIPRGKLTLLVGNPGLGKTLIATTLAAIVSSGAAWPLGSSAEPGRVLFLSGEDDVADTIRPRLEAAGAELKHIEIIEGIVEGYTGEGRPKLRMFDLQRDVDALRQKLKDLPDVVLVVIDPITSYLGEGIDSHKNAEVRSVLTPLISMIAERRVALMGVTHLSKAGSQEALMRVIGSVAFVAAARSAFLVASDPQDKARRLFLPLKENLGPASNGLAFRIEGTTILSPRGLIETARIQWEPAPVMMNADEALRPSQPTTDSALDQAKEWLRWTLRESTEAREVFARGTKLGMSQITIRRAADALNIQKRKMLGNGRWLWYMAPQDAQANQHTQDAQDFNVGSVDQDE